MDLINLETNLVPELQKHLGILELHSRTLIALRHPLVYSVPYFPHKETDEILNKTFEHKRKHILECLENKNFDSYLWMHERPYRIDAFRKIEKLLEDEIYWKLLAAIFIDTENLFQNRTTWAKLLSSNRSNKEALMDSEERRFLKDLSNEVKVYRGVSHPQQKISTGLSFTLDKEKAFWFANRWDRKGKVYSGLVKKKSILAYFSGRGESEVVILSRSRLKMELVLPAT